MQVDVGQQRRDHAALRSPGGTPYDCAVVHHCGTQHVAHQLQQLAVNDSFLERLHQPVVRDRLKTRSDIRLDHPPPPLPRLVDEDLEGVVRRALGSKPKRARQKSASKIGSSTILAAACTTRSRTAGIDNGRRSLLPGFGMNTRRAASGRKPPFRRSVASSSSSRSTPCRSTSTMVIWSMPAAPRLRRTSSHARSSRSLRWTLS